MLKKPSSTFKKPKDVIEFLRENELPDNFCIIPFINLILGPGGDISICRQKGTKHVVGNLKNEDLESIWNGAYLTKWREEFLTGKPEICKHETQYVQCHLSPAHYWDLGEIELTTKIEFPFRKLAANLNGECNLKCVMCDVWKQENGFYTEENFWKDAKTKIFPFVKEIELLSGEPLIQEDTFKLINELVAVNPNVEWTITTNGVWTFEGRIKEALDKILIKRFIFSIDSIGNEKYRKIRVGGDLETVLSNYDKVSSYGEGLENPFQTTVHFVVMRNNYEEMRAIVDLTKKNNSKLTFDLCVEPSALSLLSLPIVEKTRIIEKLISENDWDHLTPMMTCILRLISSLTSVHKKELLLKLLSKKDEEGE